MSEDHTGPRRPTTVPGGGGPMTAHGPTESPIAAVAPSTPSASAPFPAHTRTTPPQGHALPTTSEYAPTTTHVSPITMPAPARAASGHSHSNSFRQQPRHTIASVEDAATLSGYGLPGVQGLGAGHPLPPLPHDGRPTEVRRAISEAHTGDGRRPAIDWIVPVEEKPYRENTVGERLQPTLATAITERDRYAFKARITGYALNTAIGLQVLLGSLTTALSAATTGNSTRIATAILGGLATIVASYLARARGSGEPEISKSRVKDLEQFIRECAAFQMDHGHMLGDKYDSQLETFRRRFEELLGNNNRERRSSPPV